MATNKVIASIRDREMNRKEFLKYVTYVFIGVIGLKSFMALIGAVDVNPDLTMTSQNQKEVRSSYNGGKFNG